MNKARLLFIKDKNFDEYRPTYNISRRIDKIGTFARIHYCGIRKGFVLQLSPLSTYRLANLIDEKEAIEIANFINKVNKLKNKLYNGPEFVPVLPRAKKCGICGYYVDWYIEKCPKCKDKKAGKK